ncbi:transposase [Desulfamplus magnetovallimortis]|uniref:Transposase n=2 Tax=Desulfamplus magnetovallimortis TaxID=1246637 RepID=A0A1W1HCE8_9BACT|nr:transposase [Desulfamplus magnetovallimortis]
MPLASDVVSGEKADDGLYIPVIDRINESLKKPGLLFSGDCKMSSLGIRYHLVSTGHHYLCPLPLTGKTADEMEQWITQGIEKNEGDILTSVFRENDKGEQLLTANGYELDRLQLFEKDGKEIQWEERVLVIHSPAHADRQSAGLETRLGKAKTKIEALTPQRGRGKRQITNETDLLQAITKVLKEYRVEDFLHVEYEKQVESTTKFVGKGRGSNDREKRVQEKIRYQIIAVVRDEEKIDGQKKRFGWKAFVTDLSADKLSLEDAVLSYRNEYRVERIFNRLKSRFNIAPLFVRKDDQIKGLTYLLTLGVRVLTLIEFVIHRSLKQDNTGLAGMHPENRRKLASKPSAERILKAFSKINLTIIRDMAGNVILRSLTPLTSLQEEIMQRLKIHPSVYHQLEN